MRLVRRLHPVPYQATLRTTRTRRQILDDLKALDVPGAWVSEHGDTYLVFSPRQQSVYGPGRATVVAGAIAAAVLLATAANVVWIVLLPAALLAFVPLLIEEHPMLAVGVVDDDEIGVSRFTVHGHAWGELQGAVDAYMTHLPEVTVAAEPQAADAPVAAAAGAGAPHGGRAGRRRG